jgi:hypothetical protein
VTARGWLCFALGWLLGITLPGAAAADDGRQLRGTLYSLGSQPRIKLYRWEMTVCTELWTSRYRRLDGALVVEDFTRFSGQRLAEHGYVRHTIGERSSVRVRGSRLEFRYRRGAKTKTETLNVDGVFLTGPAVFPFIQRNLPRLFAGEELEFKYGVLDRLDYFTFALTSQTQPKGEARVVRIRATSPFVRMAIDPIYVTLSRGGKFMGIRGRTIIMEPKGERGVPIDADLVVEDEAPVVCPPAVAARAAPAKTGAGRAE